MFRYILYGLRIQSDLEFFQLCVDQEGENSPYDIQILQSEIPSEILLREDKKYEFGMKKSWLNNRTAWIVVKNGKSIEYRLKEQGNIEYLKTYILGYGMAMLAMQQGKLAIHCSAVFGEKGAILIAGESGAGKSTVTESLLKNGYEFMADDMTFVLPVEGQKALAFPAFPFQKLCRDAAMEKGYDLEKLLYINEEKDKFLVPCESTFAKEERKVMAMIFLGKSKREEAFLEEVTGIKKLQAVANNLFLRHLLREEKYSPMVGQKCLELASQIPIYYLGRPTQKETKREVLNLLYECIDGI